MDRRTHSSGADRVWAGACAAVLLSAGLSQGALVMFPDPVVGDAGAGPGAARPISDAAAAAFDAAAVLVGNGALHRLDFEAAPMGDFLSLTSGQLGVPGISILPAGGSDGNDSSIRGSGSYSTQNGYNTTLGGDLMVTLEELGPGEPATGVTFRFDTPVLAFGAYFTGVDTKAFGAVEMRFNNGTSQVVALDVLDGGGAQFLGFTEDDFGAAVSEVTIMIEPEYNPNPGFELMENQDVISVDDLRWVVIPEPGTALLLVLGGLLALRRR